MSIRNSAVRFALLDDIERHDIRTLEGVRKQLRILLEVHAAAEEAHFYPELLRIGSGATDAADAVEETKDAIRDHNGIRQGIAQADQFPVGTDEWWRAVAATRKENSDHMGEEERQALADFRRHASLSVRHELGIAFAIYEAEHAEGTSVRDKDPEQYVARHG